MKINVAFLIQVLLLLDLFFAGCKRSEIPDTQLKDSSLLSLDEDIFHTSSDPVITTGMTLSQMNTVINSADSGQTVWVQPGTYTITGKIQMKAGINIRRQGSENPVFDGTATADGMLVMSYYGNQLTNSSFRAITFHNIRFAVYDAENPGFLYCTFDYGKRVPGTNKNFYQDAYIHLIGTDSALIDNCAFYRRSGNTGRAIWNSKSGNTKIINNDIGDGASLGYFVTAINDTESENTLIQANNLLRVASISDPAHTDHGIYVHSFENILIKYNNISGWPPDETGGAIKARNGQHLDIFGNTMTDSGVLLYEYATPVAYPFLKHVIVSYNTVHITTNVNDRYHGISYWRNNAAGTEYSIRLSNNTLPNGTIYISNAYLDIAGFNAAGGGVFNNQVGILTMDPGINQSGNY